MGEGVALLDTRVERVQVYGARGQLRLVEQRVIAHDPSLLVGVRAESFARRAKNHGFDDHLI